MPGLPRHSAWRKEAAWRGVPVAAVEEALAELDRLPSPREWADTADPDVRRRGWTAVAVLRGRQPDEIPELYRRIEQASDSHARLEACADMVGLDEPERSVIIASACRRHQGRNQAGIAVQAALARLHGAPAEPCDAWIARFEQTSRYAADKYLTDQDKVTVVWGDVFVQATNGLWRGLELPATEPERDFKIRFKHAKIHPASLNHRAPVPLPAGPSDKTVIEPRRPPLSEPVESGIEDALLSGTSQHDRAARAAINRILDRYGWGGQSPLIPWAALGREARLVFYIEAARCWLWHDETLSKPEGDPAHKHDPSRGDTVSSRADVARRALRWVDPWVDDGNVQRRVTHAPMVAFALWSAASLATDQANGSNDTALPEACRAWEAEAANAGIDLFPALRSRLQTVGASKERLDAIQAVIDAMTNTLLPDKGQENN